jgi:hypothetical protein
MDNLKKIEKFKLNARGTEIVVNKELIENIGIFKEYFNDTNFKKEDDFFLNFSPEVVHIFLDYLSGYKINENDLTKIRIIMDYLCVEKEENEEIKEENKEKLETIMNIENYIKEIDLHDVKTFSNSLKSKYGISLFYELYDETLMNQCSSIFPKTNIDKMSVDRRKLFFLAYKKKTTADIIRKLAYYLTKLSYDEKYLITKFKNNLIGINEITFEYVKHDKNLLYIYKIYFDKYSPKYDECKDFFEVNLQLSGFIFKIIIQVIELEL